MTTTRAGRLSALTLTASALAFSALAACTGAAQDAPAGPSVPPHVKGPAMLVYTGTGGWRHEEGIAGGNLALIGIGQEAGLSVLTTEDAAYFQEESLGRFELVALNSATGVTLDADQQAAFEAWVEGGGAVLALHGSGDASHQDWPWYQEALIGPVFIGHPMDPQFQTARVQPLTDHPVTDGIDAFDHHEEWYSFDGVPGEGFLSVAGVAETGFDPVLREGAAPSGDPADHPVAWVSCPGEGKAVYSALGHSAEAFERPEHRRLLANAVAWLRARGRAGCPS